MDNDNKYIKSINAKIEKLAFPVPKRKLRTERSSYAEEDKPWKLSKETEGNIRNSAENIATYAEDFVDDPNSDTFYEAVMFAEGLLFDLARAARENKEVYRFRGVKSKLEKEALGSTKTEPEEEFDDYEDADIYISLDVNGDRFNEMSETLAVKLPEGLKRGSIIEDIYNLLKTKGCKIIKA